MSQITTHILDTSHGKPATGIITELYYMKDQHWEMVASGVTNIDGRVMDLIKTDDFLNNGIYKMHFDTGKYFMEKELKHFYPFVEIVFTIETNEHYHIPLLLNPFGYSTYRGS